MSSSPTACANRRSRFMSQGLCRCGKRPPAQGRSKTRCEECLDRNQAQINQRSVQFGTKGLCTRCGKRPPFAGRKTCGECRSYFSGISGQHGATLADRYALFDSQGGLCGICAVPLTDLLKAHVDHDHETGEIRGLLCGLCNVGLGSFRDNPDLLAKAAQYLQKGG